MSSSTTQVDLKTLIFFYSAVCDVYGFLLMCNKTSLLNNERLYVKLKNRKPLYKAFCFATFKQALILLRKHVRLELRDSFYRHINDDQQACTTKIKRQ